MEPVAWRRTALGMEFFATSHYEPSFLLLSLDLPNISHKYSSDRICNTTNIASHFNMGIAIYSPWTSPWVPYNPIWSISYFIKSSYENCMICFSTRAMVLYYSSQIILPAYCIYYHYQGAKGKKCFCHFIFLVTEVICRITFDRKSRLWIRKVMAQAILCFKWVLWISHQSYLRLIQPVQSTESGASLAAIVIIGTVDDLLYTQVLQRLAFYCICWFHSTHHAEGPASSTSLLVPHLGYNMFVPPVKSWW